MSWLIHKIRTQIMKLLFGNEEQLDIFDNKRSCNTEQTKMKTINVVNGEWKTNLYTKPNLQKIM